MKNVFNKLILAVLTAALVFASFPSTSAFAQGQNPPKMTTARMEEVWALQLNRYERIGILFNGSDARLARLQTRIDRAKANGKDVTAVQTALDNFTAALKNAKPIYASMNGLVNSHAGFDANGKVTDTAQAKSTLQALHAKFAEIKSALGGTRQALHDALVAFRAANKPTGS